LWSKNREQPLGAVKVLSLYSLFEKGGLREGVKKSIDISVKAAFKCKGNEPHKLIQPFVGGT